DRVVTAGEDRTARLWKSATGEPATPPLTHPYPVWHASFSPDGTRLATACCAEGFEGGEVRVWSGGTGELLTPPAQAGYGYRIFYSPDGKQDLAVLDALAVLGVASGRKPIKLPHKTFVDLAAFSPDGRLVLTTSRGMTAHLWEASGGSPRTPPLRHG